MEFIKVFNIVLWSINMCGVFTLDDPKYLKFMARLSTFGMLILAILRVFE